jgi:hypothetical protein
VREENFKKPDSKIDQIATAQSQNLLNFTCIGMRFTMTTAKGAYQYRTVIK